MSNYQLVIDKKIEETRQIIGITADQLAKSHQSFANDYLINVANQTLFMLGNSLTRDDLVNQFEHLKTHLLNALNEAGV